jgi:hypothetical protein
MEQRYKSQKQTAFLLSKVSPLTLDEKAKLKRELHSGAVRVKKATSKKK